MSKLIMLVILCAGSVFAQNWGVTDWAVSPDGDDDTGDGTLANPFQTIQKGVDTADADHTVWATNGVYDTGVGGSRGGLANRVFITKDITVRSFNGPEVTTIAGRWHDPGVTENGTNAVRCVYMDKGTLIGFTVTGGATLASTDAEHGSGGGIFGGGATGTAVIRNCHIVDNRSYINAGGVRWGTIYDSRITDNIITGATNKNGGGIRSCTVYNSLIARNSSGSAGGAAFESQLYNSVVISNAAAGGRGAVEKTSTVDGCLILYNNGVGVYEHTTTEALFPIVSNSIIAWNRSSSGGGGVGRSIVYNSLIVANEASAGPYAAFGSTLYNCTIVANRKDTALTRPALYTSTLYNSIVYYNSLENWTVTNGGDLSLLRFYNSCVTPAFTNQVDFHETNITDDPELTSVPSNFGRSHDWTVGNYRPGKDSPVIGKGNNGAWDMAGTLDLGDLITLPADWMPPPYPASLFKNRRPRTIGGTVDMGAYEADVGLGMPWRTGGTPWILLQ